MSFQISITETRIITKVVGKEWVKVGEKEVAREQEYYSRDKNEPRTRLEPVMAYSPLIEKPVEEKREILACIVEDLDLAAVIKAIHRIG